MRKIFVLALSIMLMACSSDDDSGSSTVALEGTWRLTSITLENPYDFNNDGNATRDLMDETDCYQNELMTFHEEGTGVVNSTSYVDIIAEVVVGSTDTFTYTIDCVSDIEVFPIVWSRSGNTVTISDEGLAFTATLSGDELRLFVPEGLDIYADDEFTIQSTSDLEFIYTKQ